MEQPPGEKVLDENGELAVCELDEAIYGIPEAAAAWYNRPKDYLDTIDIQREVDDTCVFVGTLVGHRIVLIVYVMITRWVLLQQQFSTSGYEASELIPDYLCTLGSSVTNSLCPAEATSAGQVMLCLLLSDLRTWTRCPLQLVSLRAATACFDQRLI